jgi:PAS domain S-box-containing protein
MDKENAARVYEAFNKVYVEGKPLRAFHFEVIRKGGDRRFVESSLALIRDTDGSAQGFRGVASDITKRIKAELALKESEEKYRDLVENIDDAIYAVDKEGVLTYMSPAIQPILNYRPEAFIGRKFSEFVHPDDLPQVMARFQSVLSGRIGPHEYRLFRKSGEIRWVRTNSRPIHKAGEVVGIQGVLVDIHDKKRMEAELEKHRDRLEEIVKSRTEALMEANERLRQEVEVRKKAEEALLRREEEYKALYEESKRAEEVYRSLINSSADAILIYDAERKIQYASPVFTKMFGWTREELDGEDLAFIPESEKQPMDNLFRELVETGKSYQGVETRRLTKTGRLLDVSLSASRYDDHKGDPAGILCTLRDITQTRKLQAELQHAQKMESIGTIASGVAHNFRNILSGISVNSQLIEMRHPSNASLMDIVERINNSIRRGARLVDGLMQFSRKQRTSEFDEVDLSQIVRETYELITTSFDKKIEIQTESSDRLTVMGDQSGLTQVLINLCVNARDAMPDGGVLRIGTHREGDTACIMVSDTGCGMDKDKLEKCFDPFFTTKDVGKGTGLGLSTSYGIVKDHQGDIHVYSEPGKGTTFKIKLPLASSNRAAGRNTMDAVVRGKAQKILIVDDEVDLLKSMSQLLEDIGYRPATAPSGDRALALYGSWKPDAVLMDRNMPGMDGITCTEKIIEKDPKAKIILISGYDERGPNGVDPLSKKMISGYLTKPIDMLELSQVLALLFDN